MAGIGRNGEFKPVLLRDLDEPTRPVANAAMEWLWTHAGDAAVSVPLPGSGRTIHRWRYLADLGAQDLVHARLLEGHLDAVAILGELGQPDKLTAGEPSGVWAADPENLHASRESMGWRLTGVKRYCSGSIELDSALVTATAGDGPRLFMLRAAELRRLVVEPDSWPAVGMAETQSHTLHFELEIEESAAVGGPYDYVQRRGFWAGGAGVAMCWLGGTQALLHRLASEHAEPMGRRILGALTSQLEAAKALARETSAIVDNPAVSIDRLRLAALALRAAVGGTAQAVLAANQEIAGSRLVCLDAVHSKRAADLSAYLTQLQPSTFAELVDAFDAGPLL